MADLVTARNCGSKRNKQVQKRWAEKTSTGYTASRSFTWSGYNLTVKSDLKLSFFDNKRMGWCNYCFKDHKYSLLIFHIVEAVQAGIEPTVCTLTPTVQHKQSHCITVGSCYSMWAEYEVVNCNHCLHKPESLQEGLKKTIFNEHSPKRWLIVHDLLLKMWSVKCARFYTPYNCLPIM